MDAHENGSPLRIRDPDSSVEGHECIPGSGHHRPEPGVCKVGSEPAGNVQGDAFFRNDVGANTPAVKAAVPRIDDHGRK